MSWQDDVIRIATAEIGTTEKPANSNKVKYNTWYYGREVSGAAYPWCMAFVQWVFNQANKPLTYKTASCSALLNWYEKYKPECVSNKPIKGAIVIYNFGHTGIVESIKDSATFLAIEGNTSATDAGSQSNGGGVFRRTRQMSTVTAFIIPYNVEEDEDLTGEEILKRINEYTATLEIPQWAEEEFQQAIDMGITDGSNPMALIPRYQAVLLAKRAAEK